MKIRPSIRLLVFLLVISIASAQLGVPCRYYGTVTVNNYTLASNLIITAQIDGGDVGYTVSADGVYGMPPADNFDIEFEDLDWEGRTVNFYILGTSAGQSVFNSGAFKEVDLSVDGVVWCGDLICMDGESYASCQSDCPTSNDVVAQSISWSPEYPLINQSVSFTFTVRNDGPSAVNFSNAVNFGDGLTGSFNAAELAPGAVRTYTRNFIVYDTEGTYTISLDADSGNALDESNEANNHLSRQLIVITEDTDIVDVSANNITTGSAVVNKAVSISFTVRNLGTGNASFTSALDYGNGATGSFEAVNLAPGGTYTFTNSMTYNAIGNYNITLTADSGGVLVEENEDNNLLIRTITVNEAPGSEPEPGNNNPSGGGGGGGGSYTPPVQNQTTTTVITCTPEWDCTDWLDCFNNRQKRVCVDTNTCGTDEGKPEIIRDCEAEPIPTVTADGEVLAQAGTEDQGGSPKGSRSFLELITGAVVGGGTGSWVLAAVLAAFVAGLLIVYFRLKKK
ncbi:MAG: hypothetical protein KJ709_02420 [Nanoarchaeota archaeon]|nr:hypothetical protein [Nanoarchaeota archaeon]